MSHEASRLSDNAWSETYVAAYDAVAILGCRIQVGRDELGKVTYEPADHTQADDNGMLAGNFRVDGAAALYAGESIPGPSLVEVSRRFIFTGGVTEPINSRVSSNDVPAEAAVYARAFEEHIEMLREQNPLLSTRFDRLGKPEIIEETESDTTTEGVQRVLDIAEDVDLKRVLLITNDYHCLRATAISAGEICKRGLVGRMYVSVQSAEHHAAKIFKAEHEVAQRYESYYGTSERQARIMRQRLTAERMGLMMLELGMYKQPGWRQLYEGMSTWQQDAIVRRWMVHDMERVTADRAAREFDAEVIAADAIVKAFRSGKFSC